MTEHISGKQKSKKLKEDPTFKLERPLQPNLREINTKNVFSDFEYSNLYLKGSRLVQFYGTPKMCKGFFTRFSSSFSTYCIFNWYL